nr:hypothetical protein CFP56_21527 [Quercus suber]
MAYMAIKTDVVMSRASVDDCRKAVVKKHRLELFMQVPIRRFWLYLKVMRNLRHVDANDHNKVSGQGFPQMLDFSPKPCSSPQLHHVPDYRDVSTVRAPPRSIHDAKRHTNAPTKNEIPVRRVAKA